MRSHFPNKPQHPNSPKEANLVGYFHPYCYLCNWNVRECCLFSNIPRLKPFKKDKKHYYKIDSTNSCHHAFSMVITISWLRLNLGCCMWKKSPPNRSSYTWKWTVPILKRMIKVSFSIIQSIGSMGEFKSCLKLAMIKRVWRLSDTDSGWIVWGIGGERRIRPCPNTHHMDRQFQSSKEWKWWVSANTAHWIHGRLQNLSETCHL